MMSRGPAIRWLRHWPWRRQQGRRWPIARSWRTMRPGSSSAWWARRLSLRRNSTRQSFMANPSPRVTVVIPARFGSSRFPGKPLATIAGQPLIRHVYERVVRATGVSQVVVATDDRRIHDAVMRFGGDAILVTEPFRTGTDRVAAVAEQMPGEIFINLQGDEILMDDRLITDLVTPFVASEAGMGTLKRRLTSWDEVENPAVVKVVTNQAGWALYFSRAPIPHWRDRVTSAFPKDLYFIHLGVYIFR